MYLTLKEAAVHENLTKQALYVSIRKGRLLAEKKHRKWMISFESLDEYRRNRYSRSLSRHKGNLIFDKDKGLYTIKEAAQILGCHYQHVYHATRWGHLKSKRVRSSWVIHIDDVMDYKFRMRIIKKRVSD